MNRLLVLFAFLAVVSCAPKGALLKQARQLRYQEEAALGKQPRLRLDGDGVLLRESARMGKLSEYVEEPVHYVPQKTSLELTPEEMEQNKNAL